jgi:uncharacterized protein (TIGR03000 family)
LAAAGGTFLFVVLAAGDASAQMRRMTMPASPMPPAVQPMPPLTTMPSMTPLNPITGPSNLYSNPWLQYGLNRYGYSTPYTYGYSMPYTAPGLSSTGVVNDVVVQLPIANAKVWINGVEMKGTGKSTRLVSVPDAGAGQNHVFKIKATWTIDGKTKSEERTVPLNGSGRQVVNFLIPEGR